MKKAILVELDDSKPEEEDSFKAIKEWLRWRGADED